MKPVTAIHANLVPLSLAALCVVFHGACLGLGFLSDDYVLLEAVREQGWHWLSPFPAGSPSYFRPLILWSLDMVSSDSPIAHHGANLVIHLGCTLAVYACARTLGVSRRWAWLAGAWFCLHLANLTDVYWISGRTDSLCALFFLTGLWSFLRLMDSARAVWLAITWCCMAAALLCKEIALVFGPVCALWFLYRVYFQKAKKIETAIKVCLGGMGFLSLAYLAFIRWFAGAVGQGQGPELVQPGQVVANLMKNAVFMVAPFSPSWMAEHRTLVIAIPAAVLLVFAGWVMAGRQKGQALVEWRALTFSLAVIVGAMLPTALFLPSTSPRLLYLPIALMAIVAGRWMMRLPVWFQSMFVLSLMAMAVATINEAGHWRRNDALAKRCAADFAAVMQTVAPERPFVVLGAPAVREGRLVFGNDMNQAFYFATYGRFGRFKRGSAVGQIDWRGESLRIEGEKTGPGSYRRTIAAPSAFIYDPVATADSQFAYGAGETTILALRGRGRVSAFRFSFRSKLLKEKPMVFDFNGATMVRLD